MAYGQGDDIRQLSDRVIALEQGLRAIFRCDAEFARVAPINDTTRWNEARLFQTRTLAEIEAIYNKLLAEHGFEPFAREKTNKRRPGDAVRVGMHGGPGEIREFHEVKQTVRPETNLIVDGSGQTFYRASTVHKILEEDEHDSGR